MEHISIASSSKCLLCDNKGLKSTGIYTDHFLSGEQFTILKCEECELLMTHPMPELSKLSGYYASENYISHSNKRSDLFGMVYQMVRRFTHGRKYKLLTRFSSGQTILDIGCATGEFLKFCAAKGMTPTGIEPSEKARKIAESIHNLKVGDEHAIKELQSSSFDIITMWHVLEHVPDMNMRMGDIHRLLKDNGVAFIALPNHASHDAAYYKAFWAAWDVPRHLYHFNRKSFQSLATKHGFRVISIQPMVFDSYYVSLLSEKYKNGKSSLLKAAIRGFISNYKARFGNKEYSSLIYIIKKV